LPGWSTTRQATGARPAVTSKVMDFGASVFPASSTE
jgi:hypothetical protein